MKPISLTVVLACTLFVSFSSNKASSNANITLALDERQSDVVLRENTNDKNLILRIGEPLNVSVKNLHDVEVFLPAASAACAVITIKHYSNGVWRNWSDCELMRRIVNPIVLAPCQSIEETRHFHARNRFSDPEFNSPAEPLLNSSVEKCNSEHTKRTTENVLIEREVQQTTIATPPTPFFKRIGTLTAGEYQPGPVDADRGDA